MPTTMYDEDDENPWPPEFSDPEEEDYNDGGDPGCAPEMITMIGIFALVMVLLKKIFP